MRKSGLQFACNRCWGASDLGSSSIIDVGYAASWMNATASLVRGTLLANLDLMAAASLFEASEFEIKNVQSDPKSQTLNRNAACFEIERLSGDTK